MNRKEQYKYLSTFLNKDVYQLILNYNNTLSSASERAFTHHLTVIIKVLHPPLNDDDTDNLITVLSYIHTALCQRYSYKYAKSLIIHLKGFLLLMVHEGHFSKGPVDSLTTLINNPFNRPLYDSLNVALIPEEINSKFYYSPKIAHPEKKRRSPSSSTTPSSTTPSSTTPSVETKERLNHIKGFLNSYIYELITNFVYQSNSQRQTQLTFRLSECIEVLHKAFNSNNSNKLVQSLTYVLIDICQRFTLLTAVSTFTNIRFLIRYMIEAGYFTDGSIYKLDVLLGSLKKRQYEAYKVMAIPEDVASKFSYQLSLSGEEIFKDSLNLCCTKEIAQRFEEHVNNFKNKKHHRTPLVKFLKQIFETNPEWYRHPRIIQGELLKFRGNLLNEQHRNTAYGQFQNVKNSLLVLSKQGLLPPNLELPDNLRRCINTQKIRKDNPLICEVNMYDDTKKESYVNTPAFIECLKNDLTNNLNILVTHAQAIVYEGYKQFLSKKQQIARSQFDEFIKHPKLLVNEENNHSRTHKMLNPFYLNHPLRHENLTAYYDYYFNSLLKGETPHKMANLAINEGILSYLGLTANIASAMQIIITEELGINPYSLYKVKITSDGHNYEFVQVDNEGSVRLKALKPRARNTRTRKAVGNTDLLSNINVENIDAASCLKMALEMTSRIRESLQIKELWVCLSIKGVSVASPSSFQNCFQHIRQNASFKSPILKYATLKKIRTSKGVLIYLESNGNSIKTANYLGNTVKTTLNSYIPRYLTELIYRVKIRNFQKIVLFMVSSFDESPAKALNMNKSDFKYQVKQAFNNPDMGGNLYNKLTKPSDKDDDTLFFCISDINLQLAINYAKNGADKELRDNCKNVINKVAEGPVMMKQMLRKAQIAVDK